MHITVTDGADAAFDLHNSGPLGRRLQCARRTAAQEIWSAHTLCAVQQASACGNTDADVRACAAVAWHCSTSSSLQIAHAAIINGTVLVLARLLTRAALPASLYSYCTSAIGANARARARVARPYKHGDAATARRHCDWTPACACSALSYSQASGDIVWSH